MGVHGTRRPWAELSGRLCGRLIRSATVCLGRSGKEGGVERPIDHHLVVREAVGQTW